MHAVVWSPSIASRSSRIPWPDGGVVSALYDNGGPTHPHSASGGRRDSELVSLRRSSLHGSNTNSQGELLAFTDDVLDDLGVRSDADRLAIVAIAEHVVLLLKYGIAWYVPDVPRRIKAELALSERLYKKEVRRGLAAAAAACGQDG